MATACEGECVCFRAEGGVPASTRAAGGALSPRQRRTRSGSGHHPGRDSCPCTLPSAPAIDSIDVLPPSPIHSTTLPRPPFIPPPGTMHSEAAVSAEASRPDKESGCGGLLFARGYRPTQSQDVQVAGSPEPCREVQAAGFGLGRHSLHPPLGSQQGDDLVSPSFDQPGGRASLAPSRRLPALCTPLPVSSLPRPSANFRLCRCQGSPSLCLCLHQRDPCHCRIFSLGRDSVSSCSVPPSSD